MQLSGLTEGDDDFTISNQDFLTPASFCLFSFFSNRNFTENTVDVNGIRTWIVSQEVWKHADHLITTSALLQSRFYFRDQVHSTMEAVANDKWSARLPSKLTIQERILPQSTSFYCVKRTELNEKDTTNNPFKKSSNHTR